MDLKILLGDSYKDGMTVEEISEALKNKDFVDKSVLSGYVTKDTADKYASEAANYKKQLQAKLTEDEQKAAKASEEQAAIMQELENLRLQNTINSHKTKFLELQYTPELAEATAAALAKGIMDKENQTKV